MDLVPVMREFDPEVGVHFDPAKMRFVYAPGVFGPSAPELRRLDSIRPGLRDPHCSGPDPVYAIAMDVGRDEHRDELNRRMLLYGVVAYAAGRLGVEPVRSQGHVHAIAPHCGWSTPELIEVWSGRAIVYMQQSTGDDPGRCTAIEAEPGEHVVIPPGVAHCVINASIEREMVFGAICDRQYAFEYDELRRKGGLAWFPQVTSLGAITFVRNPNYKPSTLEMRIARNYPELGLDPQQSIYAQFARDPERLQWVSEPSVFAHLWDDFEP